MTSLSTSPRVAERTQAADPTAGTRRESSRPDVLFVLLALVALAAWVYIAIRAVHVAFTTDESATYGIIHGDPTLADSANNQWLNTLLMRVSQAIFGQSELALRLPNVLAFGVYGGACLAFLRSLRPAARVVGAVLLLGDPFMLEFFGLARGYGLCLAFAAAAIACLMVGRRNPAPWREVGRLGAIGATAALAFYANFASLNFVLAVLGVAVVDLVVRNLTGQVSLRGRSLPAAIAVLCLTAAVMVPGVIQVEHLQNVGQLYYGSKQGFIAATIGSLVETWGYHYQFTGPGWLDWTVAAVAALGILWSAVGLVRARRWGRPQCAALVALLAVAATLVEATVLGTLYPTDRTALTFVLAFAVLVATVLDDIGRRIRWVAMQVVLALVAVAAVLLAGRNLELHANLTQTVTWPWDASARQTMDKVIAIERRYGRPAQPWLLISGFPRNYALDYYRQSRHLTWLAPITRAPTSAPGADFYVVDPTDLASLPKGTKVLAFYPETAIELRAGPRLLRSIARSSQRSSFARATAQ